MLHVHARRGGASVSIYHGFLFFVMHRLLEHDSEVRRRCGYLTNMFPKDRAA